MDVQIGVKIGRIEQESCVMNCALDEQGIKHEYKTRTGKRSGYGPLMAEIFLVTYIPKIFIRSTQDNHS